MSVAAPRSLLSLLLVSACLGAVSAGFTDSGSAAADEIPVTISNGLAPQTGLTRPAPPIGSGFVGVSIDYCSISLYDSSAAAEGVLSNLLTALAPNQPVLRIGGSGPLTPCPNWLHRPLSLTTGVIASIARRLRAKLILGINLESHDVGLARWEARTLLKAIDPGPHYRYVEAFELGNEPDLFPRYGPNSSAAEIPSYFTSYLHDFTLWSSAVRQAARDPEFGIAGPSLGRLGLPWISGIFGANFDAFADGPARPRLLTFHSYPLIATMPCPAINCPRFGNLISDSASFGLAAGLAPFVIEAPPGRQVRVDEMNSDTLGGGVGISNTFGSALWALDTLFELARAGISGVNVHTFPGATYELFDRVSASRWLVNPEYYGLLMFERAVPAGSRLLSLGPQPAQSGGPNVKVWAARGADGKTRIVVINKDSSAHDVLLAGQGLPVRAFGSLERLEAPRSSGGPECPGAYVGSDLCATGGVRLGGRSFGVQDRGALGGDQTTTGLLAQPAACTTPKNCRLLVERTGTSLEMPPASAALLTIG